MFKLIVYFNASLSFLLAGFVYMNGRHKKQNILFSLMAVSIAFYAVFFALSIYASDVRESLLEVRVFHVFCVFYATFLFLFINEVLFKNTFKKMWHYLPFISSVISSYFILNGDVVRGVERVGSLPNWTVPGSQFYFYWSHFGLFTTLSLVLLIIEYIRATGGTKNQIRLILFALAIGMAGAWMTFLPGWGIKIEPDGIHVIFIALAIIAYAITKHELMDIKVVITRAVAYGIVGAVLIASFIALNLIGLPLIVSIAANAALGLFWAFAAHRAREFIQTPLVEKWVTDWYDSDKLINRIATQLIPVIGKEKVFKIIADELRSAIKVKNIEVKMGKQDVNSADITQTKAGLIIPLSSSEGLEGILILGPKISEDSYSEKDLTIFRTIMVQAMAILDRIRPYEKIEQELAAAQIELDRSQRLASLGTLAAGVAHEIRNPLGIIHATAEELPDKPRDAAELAEFRDSIKKHTKRISSIITNMLGLAKTGEKTISIVDLNEVIEATLQLIPISGIKLIKELGPIPGIKGVAEELKQVLINLIDNAIHAMPAGGELTIKTFREADNICLAVSDTGQGIPQENLSKIFDPFFSTRHEGAGLGLSIVYRIVREHGADITVDSTPGRGTTFKLKFPHIPA